MFVVIHRGPGGPAMLPRLLAADCQLPIRVPAATEPVRPGHVYLPPLDCHLILHDSRVSPSHGPRENGFRPAIDPLFRSAAAARGSCVAGVVLSGALADGTAGLAAIKRQGGVALVQHPDEAQIPSMPLSALRHVEVDAVLGAAEIGPYLVALTLRGRNETGRPATTRKDTMGKQRIPDTNNADRALTGFTCPDCGGALWAIEDRALEQYECHVGHRFSSEALRELGDHRTENALWSAMRALREDAAIRRRMAARATGRGLTAVANRWLDEAREADQRAQEVGRLVEAMGGERTEQETAPAGEGEARRRAPRRTTGGRRNPVPRGTGRKGPWARGRRGTRDDD